MLDSSFLKNSPIQFSFLTWDSEDKHFHSDFELLYVFDGQMEINVENNKYTLSKDDFLIVNANKFHSFTTSKNALIGSFMISYTWLTELTKQSYIVFWCNSTIEKSIEYNILRKKICEFANEFIKSSENESIKIMSTFYDLLYSITNNFQVTMNDINQGEVVDDAKERVEQITRFIALNYKNRISLTELSEILYLSDAYLSKYIKKQFGMNFSDYLNTVRLNHAIEELLYTDIPIIRIALDNGFASISTFNKVFRDNYGMTPSKYRNKFSKSNTNEKQQKENLENILKKTEEVFGKIADDEFDVTENNTQIINIDNSQRKALNKVWSELINIGSAEEVLRSDMQKHILELKNNLNIKYVRIWDLYSPGMLIDVATDNNKYNFHKLDKVLDFLVENDISPYLELNFKSKILISNLDKVLISDKEDIVFRDIDVFEKFFNEFVIHIINRYTTETVLKWRFEYWKNERLIVEQMYDIIDYDTDEDYLQHFKILHKIFKKYLPDVKLGGAGLSTRFGNEMLHNTLTAWSKIEEQPDFLTFYSFPYELESSSSENTNRISTNRDFMKDYLKTINEIVEKSGIETKEIHITEWNSTASNRNIFNDSCFKGAYLMKNIIDNFDNVDLMGYWLASDITVDFYDSAFLINGGSGLITKDGIKKPAYYAFDFMNRLGKRFVDKGENHLTSYNGYKEWGIVCHNFKFYGYQFYTSKEDAIDYKNLSKYFENNDELEIEYNLNGVEDGFYDIKTYSINTEHGSLQDEWLGMSCPSNLTNQEIDYLKRICVPHLNINSVNVQGGKLTFKTKLTANEIQYINIRYRLK